MTADLVQFLRARLDDDEQTARETLWEGSGNRPIWDLRASATVEVGGNGRNDFPVGDAAVAWHIVRHDPARVLAEVDAKRRIVDWHERQCTCDPCTADGDELPNTERSDGGFGDDCPTLRLLALPYADHPDYRSEWAP